MSRLDAAALTILEQGADQKVFGKYNWMRIERDPNFRRAKTDRQPDQERQTDGRKEKVKDSIQRGR